MELKIGLKVVIAGRCCSSSLFGFVDYKRHLTGYRHHEVFRLVGKVQEERDGGPLCVVSEEGTAPDSRPREPLRVDISAYFLNENVEAVHCQVGMEGFTPPASACICVPALSLYTLVLDCNDVCRSQADGLGLYAADRPYSGRDEDHHLPAMCRGCSSCCLQQDPHEETSAVGPNAWPGGGQADRHRRLVAHCRRRNY